MVKNKSDLFIVCGERSGDVHGSEIIKHLLKKKSSLKIHCWGGDEMKKSGGIILENYTSYNIMGFKEVIMNIRLLYNKLLKCKRQILDLNPKLILLIDFPGFNLRIAKFAKKNGFKVDYYIPPKTWAWNPGRMISLKKYVDNIYSILPFEKNFYKKYSCDIKYVGNPLVKKIDSYKYKKMFNNDKEWVSLLPGSRISELKYSLPIFISLANKLDNINFLVCGVENISEKYYDEINKLNNTKLVYNDTYNAVKFSNYAIVMSGTASLEVALINTPQIVVYKASTISFILARILLNVDYVSLVNLILNRDSVKELLQYKFTVSNIIQHMDQLRKKRNKDNLLKEYKRLKYKIGNKDSSLEVSNLIGARL